MHKSQVISTYHSHPVKWYTSDKSNSHISGNLSSVLTSHHFSFLWGPLLILPSYWLSSGHYSTMYSISVQCKVSTLVSAELISKKAVWEEDSEKSEMVTCKDKIQVARIILVQFMWSKHLGRMGYKTLKWLVTYLLNKLALCL